ncbi:ATP-binding cassette domain-containing protein [Bacillus sp. NTK071]|uniref:ABC transporter ATP-binding protein n=1 Tax=Bacillus sp. NTK071 TaxID=2802175 RepID=UPI001A8D9831|nr:ATP-binding cassette domain-containing protein [Bacillus sp. NTK071]
MMLQINGLVKRFGEELAVDHLSLEIPKGEVLGLLGRNGAGKTTTIKMMLSLLKPDEGTILWNGQPLDRKKVSIGYLPEERGLYQKTKVVDQLRYFGQLDGMTKKEANSAIDLWLEKFGIPEYRLKMAGELSKGNQQKIQLIATLLHNPELIILDEPFSGLDPVNATMLSTILEEEISKGKTIILSSHRMEQIETFCESVIMMKKGKPVVSGKLLQIQEDYGYKNLIIKVNDHPNSSERLNRYEVKGNTYTTQVKNQSEALESMKELEGLGGEVRNFSMIDPSLHQIFVEKVK